MSKHSAKVVYTKHESDGAIAVLMRCCGDKTTDQWHTLYVKPETADQEIQAFVASARSRCEQQHGARDRIEAIIKRGV